MGNIYAVNAEAGVNHTPMPVNPAASQNDFLELFAYVHPMQATLDQALHKFEQVLNVVGYIPFVSMISGSVRFAYGKVEVIGAVAAGVLLALKGLSNSDAEQRSREIDYAVAVMVTYSIHGFANMGRGIVEAIPFVNLSCLVYDLSGSRIQYPLEAS